MSLFPAECGLDFNRLHSALHDHLPYAWRSAFRSMLLAKSGVSIRLCASESRARERGLSLAISLALRNYRVRLANLDRGVAR
jgi:hypothetical protein